MKEVIAHRERNLTQPNCHLPNLKGSLVESKILAREMKLISPTARVL